MQDKELFENLGLGDLFEETNDNRFGRLLVGLVLTLLWGALGWTTAEFFGLYGAQLGARFGAFAPLFAALFGLFTVDVAYTAWLYAAKNYADTDSQRLGAIGVGLFLFVESLAITAVYMGLTGDLAADVVDAAALNTLKTAGVALLALSTVANGVGLILWMTLGNDWRRSAEYRKLANKLVADTQQINRIRAEQVVTSWRSTVRDGLADGARLVGGQAGASYLQTARMLAEPTDDGPADDEPVAPFTAGAAAQPPRRMRVDENRPAVRDLERERLDNVRRAAEVGGGRFRNGNGTG